MRDEILRRLSEMRRRMRWVRALDLFLEAAFALTAGVAALLLIDRLAFEFGLSQPHAASPQAIALLFAGALAAAALAALAGDASRRATPSAVARRADHALALDERLLTSAELAIGGDPSPFATALYAQTARSLESVDARRVFPRAPLGYRGGIALALLAGLLLAAFGPQIAPPPHADFTATPAGGPAPLTVLLEDASQGRISSWEWDFGDGEGTEGPVANHRFEKVGRFIVRLTVRGPGGLDSKSAEIEVRDPSLPVTDFDADPIRGRVPLEVRFTNRSQRAASFFWQFGDGAGSSENSPVHRYEKPGLYDATLEAHNGNGKTTKMVRIKAAGPDAPLADFRAMPRKGPAPLTVDFEDNSTGQITAWEWDSGDLAAGRDRFRRERMPSHVYRFPGRYTVRLKVTGPGGDDELIRTRYVEVESEGAGGRGGGGGGGTGGAGGGSAGKTPPKGGQAGRDPGLWFGDQAERPKVEFTPETIQGQPRGDQFFEKVKNVYTGDKGTPGDTRPYGEAFGDYRRAAEDAMNRDRIPPALRDYVKRYFEEIRPK